MVRYFVELFCICLLFGVLNASDCSYTYECMPGPERAKRGETCVFKNPETGRDFIIECEENKDLLCDTSSTQKCITFEESMRVGFPGSICTTDELCAYGRCKDSHCTGAQLHESCNYSLMRGIGLYCDKTQCVEVKGLNEECRITEECRIDLTCHNGKCIELFSLPAGTPLAIDSGFAPGQMKSLECMSGWFEFDLITGAKICAGTPPVLLNKESPYICEAGEKVCSYKFPESGSTFQLECTCSAHYNSKGIRYCPLNPSREGNLTEETKALAKNAKYCSTGLKGLWHSCGDVAVDPIKWGSLIISTYEAFSWNLVAEHGDCIKNTNMIGVYTIAIEGRRPEFISNSESTETNSQSFIGV